jgi:hypothetical protein
MEDWPTHFCIMMYTTSKLADVEVKLNSNTKHCTRNLLSDYKQSTGNLFDWLELNCGQANEYNSADHFSRTLFQHSLMPKKFNKMDYRASMCLF